MSGRPVTRSFAGVVGVYEEAANRIIDVYSRNVGLSLSDGPLRASLAGLIQGYYYNAQLQDYAESQMQRLRDRIRTARVQISPARNTRAATRRLIETLPADGRDARVRAIADRFEHVGIPQVFRNGRRVETIQYRSVYNHPQGGGGVGIVDEFWLGARLAIQRVLHGLAPNRQVNIRLGAIDGGVTVAINRIGELLMSQITATLLADTAELMIQSNSTVEFHDIQIHIAWYPQTDQPASFAFPRERGVSGRGRERPGSLKNIKGLQDMPSEGNLCGIKVLVAGKDDWECRHRSEGAQGTNLLKKGSSLLRQTRELATRLGIPPEQDYSTTADFQRFVELEDEWRVVCVGPFRHPVDKHIWKGERWVAPTGDETTDWGKTIFVFYDGMSKHFSRIPNSRFNNFGDQRLEGSESGSNWKTCRHCLTRTKRTSFNKHKCEDRYHCFPCNRWFTLTKWNQHLNGKRKVCEKCAIACSSVECYDFHNPHCDGQKRYCRKCRFPLEADQIDAAGNPIDHECKFIQCNNPNCRKQMNGKELDEHRCYIAKLRPRAKRGEKKRNRKESLVDDEAVDEDDASSVAPTDDGEEGEGKDREDLRDHWVWDSEAMADPEDSGKVYDDGTPIINKVQIVNFIAAINAGTNEKLRFPDIGTFVRWVAETPRESKTTFWAHNSGKYDTRLVWDYALNNLPPELLKDNIVMVGSKIFELKIAKSSFRDSYLHFPQRLSTLPKMFGLDNGDLAYRYGRPLKKGFFPHSFNTPRNQNYKGPLPDIHFFEPTKHKPRDPYNPQDDDEQALKEWHAETAPMYQEDIDNGGEGWVLQKEVADYGEMDVVLLVESLKEWQRLNLEKNCCDPLTSLTLPSHAHKTLRAKFMPPGIIPVLKCYPQELYRGHPSEWKRGWDEERLARGAYYGGNVNCRRLFLELSEDQIAAGYSIVMYDIRSQYPFCMVNRQYPVGDYKFVEYTRDNQPTLEEIMETHGVISCEIEYPSDKEPLFHPILPKRRDGKLHFDLCACDVTIPEIEHWEKRNSCLENSCRICKKFIGREEPRDMLIDVHKALENGYDLKHVYWTLGTKETTDEIWKDYIACFYGLKLKSGKPPKDINWDDEDAVNEFVEVHRKMGVIIEAPPGGTIKDWFEPNEGLKALAKLMLNSVYGKMGECSHQDSTKLVNTQTEEEFLWRGDGIDFRITGRDYFDSTAVYRIRTKAPGPTLATTNVVVAASVTAHGRALLWDLMNPYGTDVLYHDTDSIIVLLRPPSDPLYKPPPHTGPYLGDLEEEIGGAHAFLSTGPKSYALKRWREALPEHYEAINYPQEELEQMDPERAQSIVHENGQKMLRWNTEKKRLEFEYVKQRNKGIVLDSDAAKIINYERMRDMIWQMHGWIPGEASLTTEYSLFDWEKENSRMVIKPGYKTISLKKSSLKGKLGIDGFTLYPIGAERFPQWQLENEALGTRSPDDEGEEWDDVGEE